MKVRLRADLGDTIISKDVELPNEATEYELDVTAEGFYWEVCGGGYDWEILKEGE